MTNPSVRSQFQVPSKIFTDAPEPFREDYARRCFRVLRMVSILHGKGFHGLRVFPYMYPLTYRIELFPGKYASSNGASYDHEYSELIEKKRLIAKHSGADDTQFFGWEDAAGFSAHQLAFKFIARFPELAKETYHLDYSYAGWYATLISHCEYGQLPYLFGEYEQEIGIMRLHVLEGKDAEQPMDRFPLPPTPAGGSILEPSSRPRWMEDK